MASRHSSYTQLQPTENWLSDQLLKASQLDLHVTVRDSKTRGEMLWLWCPTVLETAPKVWDMSSLMVSKPGGTMESVELQAQISPTNIHISGTLLSNTLGNDELVPFDLKCTLTNQSDTLFEGRWEVLDKSRSVVIFENDTSGNWWLTPLSYLDSGMKRGEPIWYKGEQWAFVKWNSGRGQVLLRKVGASTSVMAKHCLKKITQRRSLGYDRDADDLVSAVRVLDLPNAKSS